MSQTRMTLAVGVAAAMIAGAALAQSSGGAGSGAGASGTTGGAASTANPAGGSPARSTPNASRGSNSGVDAAGHPYRSIIGANPVNPCTGTVARNPASGARETSGLGAPAMRHGAPTAQSGTGANLNTGSNASGC